MEPTEQFVFLKRRVWYLLSGVGKIFDFEKIVNTSLKHLEGKKSIMLTFKYIKNWNEFSTNIHMSIFHSSPWFVFDN